MAVIIGAAFGAIVTSLTEDVIMPFIGTLLGGLDFSGYFVRLGPIPADFAGDPTSFAALKEAGVAMLGYGQFATALSNFLLVAFVIFLLVRAVNRMTGAAEPGAEPRAGGAERDRAAERNPRRAAPTSVLTSH